MRCGIQSGANGTFGAIKFRFQQGVGGSPFYEVISQKIFFFTNDGFPNGEFAHDFVQFIASTFYISLAANEWQDGVWSSSKAERGWHCCYEAWKMTTALPTEIVEEPIVTWWSEDCHNGEKGQGGENCQEMERGNGSRIICGDVLCALKEFKNSGVVSCQCST